MRAARLFTGLVACALMACQPAAEGQAVAATAAAAQSASGVEDVCFEPEGDCIGVMVREIGQARREVLVMAFLFSNRRIIRALNEAQARGVRVRMVVSISREGAGRVLAVQRNGAEVLTRDGLAQHSKYLIIDRTTVVTGSQNFTAGSENNSENTLVIDDPRAVAAYVQNWELRARGSRPSSPAERRAPEVEEEAG